MNSTKIEFFSNFGNTLYVNLKFQNHNRTYAHDICDWFQLLSTATTNVHKLSNDCHTMINTWSRFWQGIETIDAGNGVWLE